MNWLIPVEQKSQNAGKNGICKFLFSLLINYTKRLQAMKGAVSFKISIDKGRQALDTFLASTK